MVSNATGKPWLLLSSYPDHKATFLSVLVARGSWRESNRSMCDITTTLKARYDFVTSAVASDRFMKQDGCLFDSNCWNKCWCVHKRVAERFDQAIKGGSSVSYVVTKRNGAVVISILVLPHSGEHIVAES